LAQNIQLGNALYQHLGAGPGVQKVDVYLRTGNLVVWYDAAATNGDAIRVGVAEAREAAPLQLGVLPHPLASGGEGIRLAAGGIALLFFLLRRLIRGGRARPPSGPLALIAGLVALFTGYPFFRGGLRALTARQSVDTDALVTAATIASLLLRENVVALVVLWLLNVGELLQDITLRRTRRAIQNLLALGEGHAWLVSGDVEVEVPLEQISPGDVVAIYTHHKIPVDGEIVSGEGAIDQSPVTGESMPRYCNTGDPVYAGTILQTGAIRVRATRVGSQTVVGQIIRRVEQAQATRAPIQTLAERFSRRFVPFSFAMAAAMYLLTRDMRRSMTMLLVACPCAAGLSTPTAISAAIGNAARRGTLIKGGTYLEGAGRIDAVVFDKTGTLTVGRPLVTSITVLAPGYGPEEILALAASAEIHSLHPLSQAIVRHAEKEHVTIPTHEECEVVLGMGVRADMQGNQILVGNLRLMRQYGVALDESQHGRLQQHISEGETPVILAYNERVIGLIGVSDALRDDVPLLVAELRSLGVRRLILLTGDAPEAAQAVFTHLDLDEYRAQVLPEEKLEAVRSLQREGYTVAMVGDGTNDAPALALADVGIAMGAAGSSVAIEAADIALASNDLRQVASVIRLGSHALFVIRQNYALSIGVNGIGLIAAAAGTLNPVFAAMLHNLSSVAVVANSARLIGFKDRPFSRDRS
jgi:cation-transporting P-type ATPase C